MKKRRSLNNQDGMAVIEAVPLLVIFVVLISFCLGLFGVIHTATLHSIAARTYAFETFRNRTNLNYFREDHSGLTNPLYLGNKGYRYHAVTNESDVTTPDFIATERPIALGTAVQTLKSNEQMHNQEILQLQPRNQKVSVNPAWIMVGYGLCLNADCGD